MRVSQEKKYAWMVGCAAAALALIILQPSHAAESASAQSKLSSASSPLKQIAKDEVKSNESNVVKPKTIQKIISAPIVFIRKDRMSVEVADGEDLFLKVSPKVKLTRFKKVSDLSTGDRVDVIYDEVYLPDPKKKADVVLERMVKEVKLLAKAKKEKELSS